ncbi:MAG: MotA/TolQ/ExbB proton channel family protein [Planctomycetota bacterium]|nr:MotA/TolQ/ExbB proton channel family protein [Planctomycetota bacterium]
MESTLVEQLPSEHGTIPFGRHDRRLGRRYSWMIVFAFWAGSAPIVARSEAAKPAAEKGSALPAAGARPSIGDLVRRGGLIMVPIGVCSVFLVTFLLERLANMRRSKVIPQAFLDELNKLKDTRQLTPKSLEELCKKYPSPMCNVVKASLLRVGHPLLEVEKVMEDAAARELTIMRSAIRPLTAIASVAPLLGLVGTVFGMIDSFIVTSQPGLKDRTELLASGIYEALVATAAGLLVAVPALIAAYYFTGRLDKLSREMGDQLTPLVPALASLDSPAPPAPARPKRFL